MHIDSQKFAGGLECPCCITFKAQPYMIARPQTLLWGEDMGAFISLRLEIGGGCL